MITPSVVKYTVTNSELNFKKTVDSKYLAEQIEKNLEDTEKFVKVLKKYYELPNTSYSSEETGCSSSSKASFQYTDDGRFNGIIIHSSYYREDKWDGRAPISSSNTETINRQQFLDKHIKGIIEEINKVIESLRYITPSRGMFSNLPESVFKTINREIEIHQNDLNTINKYYGMS